MCLVYLFVQAWGHLKKKSPLDISIEKNFISKDPTIVTGTITDHNLDECTLYICIDLEKHSAGWSLHSEEYIHFVPGNTHIPASASSLNG
jgi:hypothetical protein